VEGPVYPRAICRGFFVATPLLPPDLIGDAHSRAFIDQLMKALAKRAEGDRRQDRTDE
jgi:hypothetical protein